MSRTTPEAIIPAQPGWTLRCISPHFDTAKEVIIAWFLSEDGFVEPITVTGIQRRDRKPDDVTRLIVSPDEGATYDFDEPDGCWPTFAVAEKNVVDEMEAKKATPAPPLRLLTPEEESPLLKAPNEDRP